jgi:hypothetical protein
LFRRVTSQRKRHRDFDGVRALLNVPISHGRNIKHIFFEANVLHSYRRRSIMQCGIRNQCSCLFICIMNYLYVLCMILMVLSCVLYMTLILFIYMYYGLFTCTNLVDVIPLFFTVFSFHLPIFDKNRLISSKIRPEIVMSIIGEIGRLIAKTGRISVFRISIVHLSSSPVCFG